MTSDDACTASQRCSGGQTRPSGAATRKRTTSSTGIRKLSRAKHIVMPRECANGRYSGSRSVPYKADPVMILMHAAIYERRQEQRKSDKQIPGSFETVHAAAREMADLVDKKKAAVKREGCDYRGQCHRGRKQRIVDSESKSAPADQAGDQKVSPIGCRVRAFAGPGPVHGLVGRGLTARLARAGRGTDPRAWSQAQ